MRRIYMFSEGNKEMRDLLGGKGANLAEMTAMRLPIPRGFTVTTEACIEYQKQGSLPGELVQEIEDALARVEAETGKTFGHGDNPLLLSVRSGAPVSMPGMMDTVLNLGLNDETLQALTRKTDNPRFTYDCYRRLLHMFGDVVLGVEDERFKEALERKKGDAGVTYDHELGTEQLQELCQEYKDIIKAAGKSWPEDPRQQLLLGVEAVFLSWNLSRARTYRTEMGISHDLGTAVNVQEMVYGHLGDQSGTGVCFSRNPSTGQHELYGEYLMKAQGEDVVAGIRTPKPISEMAQELPEAYAQLQDIVTRVEQHYHDMQDLEFTVEEGKLYMLQTRRGERTGIAAVKIAVDMVSEGLIDRDEALLRVPPDAINAFLHPVIDPAAAGQEFATGLTASPGAATGQVVFSADEAVEWKEQGHKVIMVSLETTPEDIHGMIAAQGILTARGGMTSHAAVVARGMGKPCVSGCEALSIGADAFTANGVTVKKGDWLTIDGSTGKIYEGKLPTLPPSMTGDVATFLGWADETRALGVRTNADTPADALKARELGAEGIGLVRTEHMFMGDERLPHMQAMIMSETEEERRAALEKLLPMQEEDFYGIFKAMDGLPVTIRFLDPPMHEFLPDRFELRTEIAAIERGEGDPATLPRKQRLLARAEALAESNPMLGLRGVRLGIYHIEVYEMQVRAIFQAASRAAAEGVAVQPEIMIPLICLQTEMEMMRDMVTRIAKEMDVTIPYRVGTMIEIPRAAIVADRIAESAEFFSFGTNDLTQMTYGYSRDDAEGKFFRPYLEKGVMPWNPFVSIDPDGVGELVKMAAERGRRTRPDLKLGICGEHGGDPSSIHFVNGILDYVSCSPFRVPIARLAAAQAAIEARRGG